MKKARLVALDVQVDGAGMVKAIGADAAAAGKTDLDCRHPAGWEAKEQGGAMLLEKWENKGEHFYHTERIWRLALLPSQPIQGSLRKTFLDTWATHVKPLNETTIMPLPLMRRLKSGAACAYDADTGAKTKEGGVFTRALYVVAHGGRAAALVGAFSGWSQETENELAAIIESATIRGAGNERVALHDAADLAGEWTASSVSLANYVTPGGAYAGDASIMTGESFVFRKDGTFRSFFAAVQSGKTIRDQDEGKWTLDDDSVVLDGKKRERYFVHGTGSDAKVGAFLVLSQYANSDKKLEFATPRRPMSGLWLKRKD